MDKTNEEAICDAIFTLIPEFPCLTNLFHCWLVLSHEDRLCLDHQASVNFRPEGATLYAPLKEALWRWESIQDTQGAPGCDRGLVTFSCFPQLEEEIVNMIYAVQAQIEMLQDRKRREMEGRKVGADFTTMDEVFSEIPTPRDLSPLTVHRPCLSRSHSADNLTAYKT